MHTVEKGQKIFSHLTPWFIWNAKVSGTYFSIAIVLLLLKLALQKIEIKTYHLLAYVNYGYYIENVFFEF